MAYKVVYEDENKFHVEHPDGSHFAVAKKGLSPMSLKKIQSMKPQKMADGGEVKDPLANITEPIPADQQYVPVQDPSLASGIGNYLGSSIRNSVIPVAQAVGKMASPIGDVATGAVRGLMGTPAEASPMPPVQGASDLPPQSQPSPSMPASALSNDLGMAMNGMPTPKDLDKIVGAQAGAEKTSANALSEGYKQQAALYEQQVKDQQAAAVAFQDRLSKLDDEHAKLTQAVAGGHVDPNRLYHSMGTGSKIGSAISLILGGMGGGASGNNAAMTVLQNAINRDVDAQKTELGKNETLLGENMKQYGNLYAAEAATRSQYAAIIQGQLGKIAAQTNNPIAQANAQKAIAGIQLSTMPLRQQLAQHQMAMSMLQQQGGAADPARKLNAMVQAGLIPEKESEYAYKELDRVQNLAKQRDAVLGAFQNSNAENTIGNRAAHVGFEPASVGNLQSLMMPYLKDAEGRINEQELERTDKFIPKPGDSPAKIAEKRSGLVQFLNEKSSSSYLDAKGIKPMSGRYAPTGQLKFSEGKVK